MIECSNEYIWYKKRPKRKFRRFFAFFLVFCILFGVCYYYKRFVSEYVFEICSDYSYSVTTTSVNKAVIDVFSDETEYDDIITVSKNSQGEIEMLTSNAHKINLLSRNVTDKTLANLENKLSGGIPVPLLAFTGIDLLSGYGGTTLIKTVTVSDSTCDFVSDFKSVGINQTLHSIYVEMTVNLNIEIPLSKKTTTHKTKVLICETVLVGKVPEIYLNGGIMGR